VSGHPNQSTRVINFELHIVDENIGQSSGQICMVLPKLAGGTRIGTTNSDSRSRSLLPSISKSSTVRFDRPNRRFIIGSTNHDWCGADCGPFPTESTSICMQADAKNLVGVRKNAKDLPI
jgi:hypothetical protein